MPHEMVGFKELKGFNDKKREEMKSEVCGDNKYIAAAVRTKSTMARITPAEVGRLQAWSYSRSLYMSGLSVDRVL